jgi:hypothetical protein
MSEPLEIDVFWSFRSPWSYLATPRLFEWSQQYALNVRLRFTKREQVDPARLWRLLKDVLKERRRRSG